MPIYDFKCEACGHTEDHLIRGQDIPSTWECPRCGELMRRMISASSLRFKGGGFYATSHLDTGTHTD